MKTSLMLNTNIMADDEFKKFDDIFQEFKKVNGKEQSKHTSKAKKTCILYTVKECNTEG